MNSVIGVVGGGQLAQMLVEAAKGRNVEVIVQAESHSDPAAKKANSLILAETQDAFGTSQLINACSSVTFENEWVNIEELAKLETEKGCFIPSLAAIDPLINKISQRQLLDALEIPGPEWMQLSSEKLGFSKLPSGWNFPLMAKSGKGGYDGKGTKVINSFDDLNELLQSVDSKDWLIEEWVPYEKELALVASRDLEGRIRAFPLSQTHQFNQVCDWVLAPAEVSHSVQALAYNMVASLLTKLNYVGVIAIEFFYGPKGLLVNEVAPRTHNSAHFSIEACNSSQFDQQVCIAADIPVPDPELIVPGAIMVNLLGLPVEKAPPLNDRLAELKRINGAHLHWYQKNKEIPGRKLGHVTLLLYSDNAQARREEALRGLESIRSIWPLNLTS